ncbi:MAG: hypothetical protein COV29_04015 [Candidatus Yanofskybacteria bacterium CG10_big_fil_rev_8_21_14_0_10_36_16]|uniref:Prepilin-type N-terminal cleavage/methylation domain-containing protein n=1 Tax=Candidatus Yanofskybacteria bacterium CG10_big_fil_rev_8_21_14_0_10_36_16 TaxID=1975096 RepID=A0A2J0QAC0_9BACT|nr:MAG: hypothetical protein COV29_04015 [Candidatus Yanofskybacteria bacterium CG10_big_fil_rev_8_21_14_0_10_36_16]
MKFKLIKTLFNNDFPYSRAGFTVFEMLTAGTIFTIALVVVTGSFVQSLRTERRADNIKIVQEDALFVMEVISREIRVAEIQNRTGDPDCPDDQPALVLCIIHPVNGDIVYSISNNQIHRNVNGKDTILSSDNIEFTKLEFYHSGLEAGDGLQPRITILATVKSVGPNETVEIKVQTTVSQRLLQS